MRTRRFPIGDWAWHIGGRLGTLVSPHILLYGTGGYTQARFDSAVWVTDGPTLHHDDNLDGWFAGGGAEVKLRQHVALKFEYRYADYDGNKASGSTSKTTDTICGLKRCRDVDTVKSQSDMDLEVQSVRALVVFRLDEDREPIVPLK
jgi:opacity protein-like surface antigen